MLVSKRDSRLGASTLNDRPEGNASGDLLFYLGTLITRCPILLYLNNCVCSHPLYKRYTYTYLKYSLICLAQTSHNIICHRVHIHGM